MIESEIIQWIRQHFMYQEEAILGIGDDCAVFSNKDTSSWCITSDSLVEGIHFEKSFKNYKVIGRKALARSLSDIAAMGVQPKYVLINIIISKKLQIDDIKNLYLGMEGLFHKYQCQLIGGDTTSGKQLTLISTVIGVPRKNEMPILRSGAQEGDSIFVTGYLGNSIHGKHFYFNPRVEEALYLNHTFQINAMIDLSDGLGKDLFHLVEESQTSAEIYPKNIPVSLGAQSYPIEKIIHDGEDYELLFTSSEEPSIIINALKKEFDLNCSLIGKIFKEKKSFGKVYLGEYKNKHQISKGGYEHLASNHSYP